MSAFFFKGDNQPLIYLVLDYTLLLKCLFCAFQHIMVMLESYQLASLTNE